MAEAEPERRWGRPASGRSTLVVLGFVVLLGLIAWLLAERNAHSYALVLEDGQLVVKKGILFPVGRQAYHPDDPLLAKAYAPVAPPPGAKLDEERVFSDREELDSALFDLFARWAQDDIGGERPVALDRGLGWLARAEALRGLSASQRTHLDQLRAESGWYEARELLRKATDDVRAAREKLRAAATSSSPHAGEAADALHRLDPVVDALGRVLTPGAPAPAENGSPAQPPAPSAPSAPDAAAAQGTSPQATSAPPAPGSTAGEPK